MGRGVESRRAHTAGPTTRSRGTSGVIRPLSAELPLRTDVDVHHPITEGRPGGEDGCSGVECMHLLAPLVPGRPCPTCDGEPTSEARRAPDGIDRRPGTPPGQGCEVLLVRSGGRQVSAAVDSEHSCEECPDGSAAGCSHMRLLRARSARPSPRWRAAGSTPTTGEMTMSRLGVMRSCPSVKRWFITFSTACMSTQGLSEPEIRYR